MNLHAEFKNPTTLVAETKQERICLKANFYSDSEVLQSELSCLNCGLNVELKDESQCMCETFQEFQVLQGHTPIKGVDYFTEEDINEVAERAYELVQTGGVDTRNFIKVSQVGKNLEIDEDGKLNVVTTDKAEVDNTKPITSSAVNVIVGNIDALLGTI